MDGCWEVVRSLAWRGLLTIVAALGLGTFAQALLSAVGGDSDAAGGVALGVIALVLLASRPAYIHQGRSE